MKNIQEQLKQIEKERNVKILYACETGSRAWGFPSPDSDYDVRFIYMHPRDWYLSLSEKKDTIDMLIEDELDINGWDLKKCLTLLKKSNAPLIERFQSPIVYYAEENFRDDFMSIILQYYSPKAVYYHHYSIAKKFWEEIKDAEEIKLKGYFYMIRSLLSCNWIIKEKSVLPMDIDGLMQLTSDDNREVLKNLINLKATVGEKYFHRKDSVLQNMAISLFEYIEEQNNNLAVNDTNYSFLDEFFLKTIYANSDNS